MSTPQHVGWNNRRSIVERAEPDQRIWFISDLHIGDATPSDVFFGKDQHLIALIRRVEREGSLLVIAGDAIDFNQAWSMSRVLAAHRHLFSAMSRLAREGRLIYILGNHDYEINLFQEILNFRVCDELHIGDKILCLHGWQFDPYLSKSVGKGHAWNTTVHHLVERYLDTWLRVPLGEFYTVPNRLMFWLAHKLGLANYYWAKALSKLGFGERPNGVSDFLDYWARANMGDSMGMFRPAIEELKNSDWQHVVAGHSHLPGVVRYGEKSYCNTGSWTFSSSHYLLWDGADWTCRDWLTGRQFDDEFYLPLVDGSVYAKDFWQWWRENYMGFLRFREGEERKGRLRGWESYVRDYQYLSQLRPEPLSRAVLDDDGTEDDAEQAAIEPASKSA